MTNIRLPLSFHKIIRCYVLTYPLSFPDQKCAHILSMSIKSSIMSSTFAPIFLAISIFSGKGRWRYDQMSSASKIDRAGL